MSDFAYAIRSLARSRGFTVAAILTLSIGIGATTRGVARNFGSAMTAATVSA